MLSKVVKMLTNFINFPTKKEQYGKQMEDPFYMFPSNWHTTNRKIQTRNVEIKIKYANKKSVNYIKLLIKIFVWCHAFDKFVNKSLIMCVYFGEPALIAITSLICTSQYHTQNQFKLSYLYGSREISESDSDMCIMTGL